MSQHIAESKAQDHRKPLEIEKGRNRKISDSGHELAQYIRDLYASGARLWTKDMFHEIEAELAKATKASCCLNGVLRPKQTPFEGQVPGIGQLYVRPYFKIYQQMVHDAEEEIFELDPDDKMNWDALKSDIDHDKALATRALTLIRQNEHTSTINYVVLKAAWDEAQRNWNQSSVCRELIAVLGTNAHIPMTTNKIVCFGLGSLELGLDDFATCDSLPLRTAMTQHAAALTVAAVLAERLGTAPLPILAQDPAYSLVTKRILMDAGIEVLEGHGSLAFTYVDEGTLVFSCHPNIPVKQVVADIAKPAAMIWNRVKPAVEEKTDFYITMIHGEEVLCSPWLTDEDSPRTRKLVEDYNKFEFPTERDRFGDLEIYIRRD